MKSIQRYILHPALLILGLTVICFMPFLGLTPLFDWDEINFAESAREMLVSGNYYEVQIHFQPFYEKPPLFFWMQALAMQLMGVNEWAARMPNVLAGYLTLLGLFYIGKWMRDQTLGYLLALLAASTWLPALYFRTGIIDPWFNLFILTGIALYPIYLFHGRQYYIAWLSGLCIGLAVLTKGPVAILMFALCIAAFMLSHARRFSSKFILHSAIACMLPLILWYGGITWYKGTAFLEYFVAYQIELFTQPVAGHQQPWFYHLVVVMLGCFPVSIFWFQAMKSEPDSYKEKDFLRLSIGLFAAVLIVFSISETKIVHYSSLAWIPGIVVTGIWLRKAFFIYSNKVWNLFRLAILIWGVIIGIGVLAFGIMMPLLKDYSQYIGDRFIKAGLLGNVNWTGYEALPGLFLTLGAILIWALGKRLMQKGLLVFFAVIALYSTLFLHSVAFCIAPRIAEITQGPAIDFYRAMKDRKVILKTEGFKSYAHYFYGAVQPETQEQALWPIWMIMRADRVQENTAEQFPLYREAFRKGGFVFFLHMPNLKSENK